MVEKRIRADRIIRPLRIEGDLAFIKLSQSLEAVIDAADAPSNPPLSDLSSLRKGAEDMRTAIEDAIEKLNTYRGAAVQTVIDQLDAALVSGSREDGPSKRPIKECCDSEGQPCSRCLEAALSYTSREKSNGK